MEFRPATPDDVEAIRSIAREAWDTDYPDVVSQETVDEGFDEWYATEELERELREGDAVILVAEADGDPVGFAHGVASEGVGNVLRLYVHPDARGRGVGTELLERTAGRLAAAGADRLRAMVLAENDAGQLFYRAAGFEAVDEAETTIGSTTEPELTFERSLRAPAEST